VFGILQKKLRQKKKAEKYSNLISSFFINLSAFEADFFTDLFV